MRRRRVLAAAVVTAALLLAGVAATQRIAAVYAYDPALDGVLLRAGALTVYRPWQGAVWAVRWGGRDGHVYASGLGAFALVFGLALLPAVLLRRRPGRPVRPFAPHAWGTLEDARAAGLVSGRGVVIGSLDGTLLSYDGPEHHLVTGGTRSGKGVGHVIPTLLSWPGSAVVYDLKGELWEATAGWRAEFGRVLRFNPTDPASVAFNPLAEVDTGAGTIRDVQNLVDALANPAQADVVLDIWDRAAGQLLVGLVLHALHAFPDEAKTLAGVRDALLEFDATATAMRTTAHGLDAAGAPAAHPEVRRVAAALTAKSERYRTSVLGTAETWLTLYADPIVAAVTGRSGFAVGDLMCGDRPVTLYIQPPPADERRTAPLVRLLLGQILRGLMAAPAHDRAGRPKRHRLLLLLDEFPSLGRLTTLERDMTRMAGYGVKAMLVAQSLNAITQAYGRDNLFIDNCHVLTAFASADAQTQTRISALTGEATEYREAFSRPRTLLDRGGRTVSSAEQVRPLLTPGQVRTLDDRKQLVFVTGCRPFLADKLRYFADARFTARLRPAPAAAAWPPPDAPPAFAWAGRRGFGTVPAPGRGRTPPGTAPPPEPDGDDPLDPPDLTEAAGRVEPVDDAGPAELEPDDGRDEEELFT